MVVNLISLIVVFIVSMGINFILTPFILKSLGNEAYGFIGLANSIVSYALVITIAINSMCARFVAYEWHKDKIDNASAFYSSVVFANIIFSGFIVVASAVFIINLEHILNIPQNLKTDIRLTFAFYFLNFCVGLFNGIFSIGIFVKNKLYLISIRNAISILILAFFILLLFSNFKPLISYVAASALISSVFVFFSTFFIARKITPELKFKISKYNFSHIKTLAKSGIFNSFNALNRILLTGMDLFISNIFLGSNSMGILAVSKAAPMIIESFTAQISAVFAPKFIELYSKNDTQALIKQAKFSMKVVSLITTPIICLFIVFGSEFYTLWLSFKTKDEIKLIYELSIIALVPIALISQLFALFSLDTTTDKLKRPAVANLILGLSILLSQIAILKLTNYGIYGIVAITSLLYSTRIALFDPLNAALNLNVSKSTFFKTFFKTLSVFITLCILMFFIKNYINLNITSWSEFIIICLVFGGFGYIFCIVALFDKGEKASILSAIKTKLKATNEA